MRSAGEFSNSDAAAAAAAAIAKPMRSAGEFSNSDAAAAAAVAKSMRSAGKFSISNAAAVIREESAFQLSNKVLLLLLLLLLEWICRQQVHSEKRFAACTTPACACKHNRLGGSFTHQASVCRRQQRDGFADRKGEVCHTAHTANRQSAGAKRQTEAARRMTGAVRRKAGAAEGQTRRLMGRLAVKTGTAD